MYLPGMLDRPGRIPIVHLHDEVAHYIKQGALTLHKDVNTRPVTLHDPCNFGRACNMCDTLRVVMNASVSNFVEMTPNRERNFCCGGGSAILFDDPEMYDLRIKFSAKRLSRYVQLVLARMETAFCVLPAPFVKHSFTPWLMSTSLV
ncbi:hypothetical protein N752_30795 [Desulforamulus aquiferis]|nr:hypothetical protein N752_30795 [Desulforamulus aquiferis]